MKRLFEWVKRWLIGKETREEHKRLTGKVIRKGVIGGRNLTDEITPLVWAEVWLDGEQLPYYIVLPETAPDELFLAQAKQLSALRRKYNLA